MSRRFSQDEARQIFANAAERQHSRQRQESAALTLAELEEAGAAAGLDPEFVRAAAADALRPDRGSLTRRFMGLPVELRKTRVLSAALDEDDWSKIVAHLRHVFGTRGVTNLIGSTREWSSSSDANQMPVHLVVEREDDVTRLTIERKTWPMAVGFGTATIVTLVTGIILGIVWLGTGLAGPLWIPSMVLVAFSIMFGIGSWVGVRAHEHRDAKRFDGLIRYAAQLADRRPESPASMLPERGDGPEKKLSIGLDDHDEFHDRVDRARHRDRT